MLAETAQVLGMIRGAIQLADTGSKLLSDLRSQGKITEQEYNDFKDSMDDTDASWREQLDRLTGNTG